MFCKKPKAQAGLEYLMTYGWALVLIVTVASALFFVLAPPQSKFVCTSSDPTKILLESYNLPYSPDFKTFFSGCDPATGSECDAWGRPPAISGKMVLRNATGGDIRINGFGTPVWSGSDSTTVPGCNYRWCFLAGGTPCTFAPAPTINATLYSDIPANPVNVSGGQNIVIDNLSLVIRGGNPASTCPLSGFSFPKNPYFTLAYLDRSGYEKTVTITCSGYPPKA